VSRSTPTKARSRTLNDLRLGNAGRLNTGGVYEDTKKKMGDDGNDYCGSVGREGIRGSVGVNRERERDCRRLGIVLRDA